MNHAALRTALSGSARTLAVYVSLATLLAACSPTASPLGSATVVGGTPSPAATPTGQTLSHPSGRSDVVLRLSEGGGLMFPEIRAIDAPLFTLYGDGRFISKPASNPPAIGGPGPATAQPAWRTGMLTEAQVQELLRAAADVLGPARIRYELNTVMDAPTTTFVVTVEGQTKTVEAYALGLEQPDNPDVRSRAALKALAEHLKNFEQNSELPTADYKPERYRGVLVESGPVVGPQVRAWPWPDIAATDFVSPADPTGLALPRRSMTQQEIAALRVTEVGGGLTGLYLSGAGGKVYAFALRPLLPDETS